jgi:hypothetical protein
MFDTTMSRKPLNGRARKKAIGDSIVRAPTKKNGVSAVRSLSSAAPNRQQPTMDLFVIDRPVAMAQQPNKEGKLFLSCEFEVSLPSSLFLHGAARFCILGT